VATDQLTLQINGMTCAGCASRVERALDELAEVQSARVNVVTGKAYLAGSDLDPDTAVAAVKSAGYEAKLLDLELPQTPRAPSASSRKNAQLALLLAAPVFILEMGGHLIPAFHHWQVMTFGQMPVWLLQWVLTTLVLFGPGRVFLRVGLPLLWRRDPNMDSLVALGSLSAWIYSSLVLFAPDLFPKAAQNVYFEAAAVIVALILLGRWLEDRAKSRAGSAITHLLDQMPATATIQTPNGAKAVPVAQVMEGDHVLLKPGERAPVDGIVIEGASELDEAMLTGEPLPVPKGPDDLISGGTTNGAGALTIRATKVGADTMLAQIVRTVEQAQATRLPIQSMADQVVRIFVPGVILIAVLSCCGWLIWGPDPKMTHALIAAVSVLIIACPCAMGLATPTSIMVASGRGADMGLLFAKGDALQGLDEIDVIAFDKTGTLTEGRPQIVAQAQAAGVDPTEALIWAAALEAQSEHPIAKAFQTASKGLPLPDAKDIQAKVGHGITGDIAGNQIALLSLTAAESQSIDLMAFQDALNQAAVKGQTPVVLTKNQQAMALFLLEDQPKAQAQKVIAHLKSSGLRTVLISGDRTAAAEHLAQTLGMDAAFGQVLPAEKAARIKALQGEYGRVAFVGDGMNDAPALAQADVGIAMGTGTDVAIESADLVLRSGALPLIDQARALSRATMRNIRQNLFWAFAYNILLIPVAAGAFYAWLGWQLSPMLGAGAMALSSLFVILNALRLRHIPIPHKDIL
jgi:Cu+-exporting ATPase